MKIYKIIIDEMPNNCNRCTFETRSDINHKEAEYKQTTSGVPIPLHQRKEYRHCILDSEKRLTLLRKRPSWCPLVTSDKLTSSDDGLGWIVER